MNRKKATTTKPTIYKWIKGSLHVKTIMFISDLIKCVFVKRNRRAWSYTDDTLPDREKVSGKINYQILCCFIFVSHRYGLNRCSMVVSFEHLQTERVCYDPHGNVRRANIETRFLYNQNDIEKKHIWISFRTWMKSDLISLLFTSECSRTGRKVELVVSVQNLKIASPNKYRTKYCAKIVIARMLIDKVPCPNDANNIFFSLYILSFSQQWGNL